MRSHRNDSQELPPPSRRSAAKHGVTFEEATTVFLDLDYLLIRDALEPERFMAFGMSSQARVLFVVHCELQRRARRFGLQLLNPNTGELMAS